MDIISSHRLLSYKNNNFHKKPESGCDPKLIDESGRPSFTALLHSILMREIQTTCLSATSTAIQDRQIRNETKRLLAQQGRGTLAKQRGTPFEDPRAVRMDYVASHPRKHFSGQSQWHGNFWYSHEASRLATSLPVREKETPTKSTLFPKHGCIQLFQL